MEVAVVNLYCTVKDRQGRLATNLAAGDFEIHEDGRRQQVRYFSRETDRPLSLALLMDTSISQKEVLPAQKEAAGHFLQQVLRPVDQAMIMSFDVNVEVWHNFTSETPRLHWALNRMTVNNKPRLKPGEKLPVPLGGTRLFDAIHEAASERMANATERRVIILISDGVDAGSKVSEQQAVEAVQRADAMLYAIRFTDPAFYWRAANKPGGGDPVLRRITAATGGRVLFPADKARLQEAFDEIASELRSQYSLGYTPINRARDGRFRRLDVRVLRDGYQVQARRGYFAPGP